jgi:hypothetical protein
VNCLLVLFLLMAYQDKGILRTITAYFFNGAGKKAEGAVSIERLGRFRSGDVIYASQVTCAKATQPQANH